MPELRPKTVVPLIVSVPLCALGVYLILFWTLPSFELDRMDFQLARRVRAHLHPDEAGRCALMFVPGVTDSRLANAIEIVSDLDDVRLIQIPSGTVSSQGYEPLTRLRQLTAFWLECCPIDAQGMDHIVAIRGLHRLAFYRSLLDTNALQPLREARELEHVTIDGGYKRTRIDLSQEALDALCAIRTLKRLDLLRAGVSASELKHVRSRRPDVTVEVAD